MRRSFSGTAPALRGGAVLLLWVAVVLATGAVVAPVRADGTWTMAPPNTEAGGQAFGLWLMTDGTVLSHGSALNHWVILTPDKKGSYANGTWKKVASSVQARGGAQQHVLKDGRFWQIGGEYVNGPACTPDLCMSGETYDPVADKWTEITPAPFDVGDSGTSMLDDGKILVSNRKNGQIQIYDPEADKWTMAPSMPLGNGQENAWASLQNGNVLAVGYKNDGAAIYIASQDKWVRTGAVPSGFDTGDTGGISLMFDGRVYVYGFGKSYIYSPGATVTDPGTWALGPPLLDGDRAEDEFSDTLPNGKVWGGLVQMTYGPGVVLQEFDPVSNTSKSVPPPPDKGNPYPIGYINLPNGEVMVTAERNDWIYTLDDGPQDEWRPTVTSVTYDSASKSYALKGTQLSGLINGADEGDDMSMAENYPIVWLTDESGDVFYCRSYDFSNMMPRKGDAEQSCQFTTPEDLAEGTYELFVSAVGVISKVGVPFTVGKGGTPTSTGSGGTGATDGGMATDAGGAGGMSGASGTGAAGSSGNAGSGSAVGVKGSGGMSGGSSGSGAGTGNAGTSAQQSDGPAADKSGSKDSSGCGCHVATGSPRTLPPVGTALLLGLAWLRVRRRRRCAGRVRMS